MEYLNRDFVVSIQICVFIPQSLLKTPEAFLNLKMPHILGISLKYTGDLKAEDPRYLLAKNLDFMSFLEIEGLIAKQSHETILRLYEMHTVIAISLAGDRWFFLYP